MTTTSNLNVTNLYELTAVTFYLCRDLEFEYLMQMFHQNICISCLPLLFKFGVHSVVTIWYCLRDWELHDHTQTCERSPVWLCLKINVSIICETLSANITYITFCLIYTFECVWTCVHTWIIHRFGQGITSIKLLKQDHVTAWGECHRAHTLCKQYQHTKCAENTHVRWQKKHKCTLLHTLVHSRTLSHTLAHFHTLSHTAHQIGLFSCSSQLSGSLITHQTDNNLGDNTRVWIHTHSRERGSVCRTGRSSEGARRGVRADGLRTCEDGEGDWKKGRKKKLQNGWKRRPGPLTSHHEGTLMHRSCI